MLSLFWFLLSFLFVVFCKDVLIIIISSGVDLLEHFILISHHLLCLCIKSKISSKLRSRINRKLWLLKLLFLIGLLLCFLVILLPGILYFLFDFLNRSLNWLLKLRFLSRLFGSFRLWNLCSWFELSSRFL